MNLFYLLMSLDEVAVAAINTPIAVCIFEHAGPEVHYKVAPTEDSVPNQDLKALGLDHVYTSVGNALYAGEIQEDGKLAVRSSLLV